MYDKLSAGRTSEVLREQKNQCRLQSPSWKTMSGGRMERNYFVLIELVVVLVILGVFAYLLFGTLSRIREMAEKTICADNLKKLGAAASLYATHNDNALPPYAYSVDGTVSWASLLCREIDSSKTMNVYDSTTVPEVFICPAENNFAMKATANPDEEIYLSYGWNCWDFGIPVNGEYPPEYGPFAKLDKITSPSSVTLIGDSPDHATAKFSSYVFNLMNNYDNWGNDGTNASIAFRHGKASDKSSVKVFSVKCDGSAGSISYEQMIMNPRKESNKLDNPWRKRNSEGMPQ